MKKLSPSLFLLTLLITVFFISFNSNNLANCTFLPQQNILVPSVNPTETQDGSYGTIQADKMVGIGYLLPTQVNGSGYWYMEEVRARFSCGGANTYIKAVLLDENRTILAISNIVTSTNTSLLWYSFTFNVQPALEENKFYYAGLICSNGAIYVHVKMNGYASYHDIWDDSNNYINPTSPESYQGTGQNSLYFIVSNFAEKSYNYYYEPNSINSGGNTLWAYDYVYKTYGIDAYCPIGIPIVYIGQTFVGGLKTGNGTFTVYKTPLTQNSNQWQIGIYTQATNGTIINGVFTFGFTARDTIGYEGVQIIINITTPTLANPIYTINHNFKWGADSNGNIPTVIPTPFNGGGSGNNSLDTASTVFYTIFGNIYNDIVFIIFGVICGLLTWKLSLTGLIAGIGVSTLLCTLAGLLPIWAVGLCIVLDVTLIILGSGLLNKNSNKNVGT